MGNELLNVQVKGIVSTVTDFENFDATYEGILLCEGTPTSVDVKLYQAVYPLLLVIPVGGWSDVMKLVSSVRRKIPWCTVLGIIDRDSRSKGEIKRLRQKGIYCTKLPFIENVISCPEVIQLLSRQKNLSGDENLQKIQRKLMHILSQKLRGALPINIPIGDEEPLASITIKIKKMDGMVLEKTVDEANIMYAYRDKAVANEASDVLGIIGRKNYYRFFIDCLDNHNLGPKILKCVSRCLPIIELPHKED